MAEDYIARGLKINGIVQGVGFRPFVFLLANRYGIKGEIANTSSGVSIYVEGIEKDIESFCKDLVQQVPPLARITNISSYVETLRGLKTFSISESISCEEISTLISPDAAVCEDCLKEMTDPQDRRYLYPFINCTNCGPRYTIISDIPYDRANTSMKQFTMCHQCQAEYDDPANRRFHAQPNACPVCGPQVSLYDNKRTHLKALNPIEETAMLLKQGYIIAIKGLGGFHLAADARNHDAVVRLRKQKHREEKPFALMSSDLKFIRRFAVVEPEEETLLLSIERPIVLLKKKEPNYLSDAVSPRNNYFGVMLPYTPLHYLLFRYDFDAIVMTSGNQSDEPIAIENQDAFDRLSEIADYFLMHNRDIYQRSDDSIVRTTAREARLIRRSRGYVPVPVFLKAKVPQILACGAELKNTICLTKEDKAFLSQHIGDLENLAAYEYFKMTIEHIRRILNIDPQIIAHDLHPDYLSTQYAMEQDIPKIGVQHHHAHIVSCMAENQIEGAVIGLAFDGTGYGTDGKIWGGEILIAEPALFRRAAHLSYIPMPGSASAIKEPWRMAISYLYETYGDGFRNHPLPLLKDIPEDKINVMVQMIQKKVNSPETSSLGRLFDGIAAIMGIRNRVNFEGQAAMELEMLADENITKTYDYQWVSEDMHRILIQPIVCGVVEDMKNRVPLPEISGKFHRTLICLFAELCEVIRKETGLNQVALSGGVFQNGILLRGLIAYLENRKFQVYINKIVPANDGGISLGQALAAAVRSRLG